ncbi:Mpo1-like protein [Pseudoalteromonas sp. YIC-827]|uniref:Mpo1-like protein n=1 Tax=Pseudoalteromonas qingdaonensis TaxID=3131913 RepID=A0ABU9MVT2_9GAMM
MKSLVNQLANYASYHRDRRNIYTHFIGIPLIVYALVVLLSRPSFTLSAELTLTPATLVVVISCVYYLFLSLSLGLVMTVLMAFALLGAAPLAALPWAQWLGWGVGLFLIGWVFQFIGHYFEGKKPAFVDDLIGLIIGPLFVVVELLFMLGLYKDLKAEVEQIAGKVR